MIEELVKRAPVLESIKDQIGDAYRLLEACYENGGKLLIAGNGGSAADSDHIVGELMKGFVKRRPVSTKLAKALKQTDPERGAELAKKLQGGLPAIALTNHAALSSAFANDVDGTLSYAQQVNGYGKEGDIFLGISTSGKGTQSYRSHRKDRRKACEDRGCFHHRSGTGDLQDPGTSSADLPRALPDAGRPILCGIGKL